LTHLYLEDNKFYLYLNPAYEYRQRALLVIKSALSTVEVAADTWQVDADEIPFLQKKLNLLGLTGKTITDEAYERLQYIKSVQDYYASLKRGRGNEEIAALLEGKIKSNPYDDQLTAIAYLYQKKRAGLFDCMGTGKTLVSLATYACWEKRGQALVICPNTVMPGFEREVYKHTYFKPLCVPNGRKKAVKFLEKNLHLDWDILLVHPENLIGSSKKEVYGEITNMLVAHLWGAVLVDEFHMYKNLSAKRTKCVLRLLGEARNEVDERSNAIVMTGTPVSESPLNAYVALKSFGFSRLPHISRFEDYFVIKKKIKYGDKGRFPKVVGYKNLDELKHYIENISIRRTKSELKGFPEKSFMTRDIELGGNQLKLYRALTRQILDDLPSTSKINILGMIQESALWIRLRQLLNSPELIGEKGESAKYLETDFLLEEILSDPKAKVVIWTEYRKAVDLIHQRYDKEYGAIKLYGGITNDYLRKAALSFEEDALPRVAVAIPAKAGTGVDWLARARTSIYIDRPCSYTLYKQSIDRIHRRISAAENLSELDIIRSQPATIIFQDVVHSVDYLIRDKLLSKENMADALTISDEKLVEMGKQDLLQYLK